MSESAAAFPVPKINNGSGMTARMYAAIQLRVPSSGVDWLDDMIRRSHKLEASMKPIQIVPEKSNIF